MSGPSWRVIDGDALDRLRELPDESVHCVVTSPPYWGLRDYGVDGQIGLEPTLDEFLEALVGVFREVRRVLRSDGVCWVNMGDSYASKQRGSDRGWDKSRLTNPARVQKAQAAALRGNGERHRGATAGLKEKDLVGQPWRLAFALQADGWWLRSEVIWSKPTPMPESVEDRPTRSHEQVFLLTKAPRYFYDSDAIREPLAEATQRTWGGSTRRSSAPTSLVKSGRFLVGKERRPAVDASGAPLGANKRSVWTVAPRPFPEAHFATYPPGLVEPCILAGTSAHGACAECGAPWRRVVRRTAMVIRPSARVLSRDPVEARTAASGTVLEPPTRETVGWQPSCSCWDEEYRRRSALPRRARKRAQRLASGDWWRRVRAQPGDPRWPVVPCTVLDPFSGAATTGVVAGWYRRSYIGIELNPEYAAMSRRRLEREASPVRRPRPQPQPEAQLGLDLEQTEAVA